MRVTDTVDTEAAASAGPGPDTAGARLRAAREAAGLSLDAVAQQLKLAPRQVQALEDDDFQRLPGRTFVRGFARNYARFVQLDPDAVLALLPAPESAPALERPTFAAARRPMGEIPVDGVAKPPGLRWLFPMLLVVVIGAAGYYEYMRQHNESGGSASPATTTDARSPSPGPATAPVAASSSGGTSTTTLPNPVSDTATTGSVPKDSAAAAASPAASATTSETTAVAPASTAGAPASAAPPATAADAKLVLTFKGTSWAEVKDASGRVILQMTGGAGMTQTVSGTPPFELALGNAPEVGVTYRGQSLDLAPYTRGSVARVALK
jgi:cytoskeleton protein RodZ